MASSVPPFEFDLVHSALGQGERLRAVGLGEFVEGNAAGRNLREIAPGLATFLVVEDAPELAGS